MRHLCFAQLLLGRYDEAVPSCERAAALTMNYYEDQLLLVAAYAQKGEAKKATIAKAELLRRQPGLTIANSLWLHLSDNPAYLQQLDTHLLAGLRKVGIPEQ